MDDAHTDSGIVSIPAFAIKGRLGEGRTAPGSFTAHIDTDAKRLRIDNADNLSFWIEIDLSVLSLQAVQALQAPIKNGA